MLVCLIRIVTVNTQEVFCLLASAFVSVYSQFLERVIIDVLRSFVGVLFTLFMSGSVGFYYKSVFPFL